MPETNLGATGTLGTRPLPELLVYALDRRLDGSLILEAPDGTKSALLFERGVVVKTRLGVAKHRLGEVCVLLSVLSEQAVNEALASTTQGLSGQRFRERGLSSEGLERALEEQLLLHVQYLAMLPKQTVYGYYAGRNYLQQWGGPPLRVQPLLALWRCFRASTTGRSRELVERLGEKVLRLNRSARLGLFGFTPREQAVLDVLRAKPQSFGELVATELVPGELLERMIYMLALTRHLDLGGEPPLGVDPEPIAVRATEAPLGDANESKAPKSAASDVKPSTAATEDPKVREIQAMAENSRACSYYELLGVQEDADQHAVQSAFFQLAKQWHPDKLSPDLAEWKEEVSRIFARMSEAHRVLSTKALREEYDRLSSTASGQEEEQETVQKVLRAAAAFQKAEVLVRRSDWAEAEKYARKALEEDPDQAEYGALMAWIQFKSGQRTPGADMSALVETLNRSSAAQPKNVQIRYYRAQLFKHLGKTADAMRDFRAIVELQPNHVEAQRELRLFRMRRGEPADAPKPEPPGLFRKFFRKG